MTEAGIRATNGDFRVRRGGSLELSGTRQAAYVEAGGEVDVSGQGITVFVAKGGRATVGGQRNQVIAEHGANIAVIGPVLVTTVSAIDIKVNPNSPECR